jgi:predicted esterase
MLLIYGRQDHVIPVSQFADIKAALTAAGVRNELLLVNAGHGLDSPAHYSYLVRDVLEFLGATWKY